MKNKYFLISLIILPLALGIGFYAGMKYQGQNTTQRFSQQGSGQSRTRLSGGFRPVNGEILSIGENQITVKLIDGQTKIVFLTSKTSVRKTDSASLDALKKGITISVFGTENSDGTVSAQNIQLNPENGMHEQPEKSSPTK